MVFTSTIFLLIFFPIALIGYYLMPKSLKNIFLLLMSFIFYAWGSPKYIVIILISILINFHTGLLLDKYSYSCIYQKIVISLSVITNLGLLFYFKYLGFAVINLNKIISFNLSVPDIVLPIGISFFTFQGMSYIIDVYRRKVVANHNLLDIALYIALFPQLIAGPIVNYKDISLQLHNRAISIESFSDGIDRFIVGLSKKVLIADILGQLASKLLPSFSVGIDFQTSWLYIICYTFQIYFDFSAYSDMAIGLGKMFGFTFLENFNYPYIANSVTDFWRRWHISLSTWFRDYLYIPLGGNRKGNIYFNLLVVFCATGLWHGAQWQFFIWGLYHGIFLLIEKFFIRKGLLEKVPYIIRWIYTIFVVMIGWVFFSADGITSAFIIIKTLFGFAQPLYVEFEFSYFANSKIIFTLILAVIFSTPLCSNYCSSLSSNNLFLIAKRCFLLVLFIICVSNIVSGAYSPFIYFRF